MEKALMCLYTHFGVHMLPPPTPHCPPERKHTDIGDEAMMTAITDMVVQIVRETLED